MSDTRPEADAVRRAVILRRPPMERRHDTLRMRGELCEELREVALASAFRGAMRATMDVDLVIDPTAATLERFVDHVEALGRYVSRDAARDALAERTMCNVIDPDSGWKAALIVCKTRANLTSRRPRGVLLRTPD